ncbi:sterol desaturase family protein [Bacillus pseudomycoides]|uniref:sterol desaturase family protein n=1 Tax=Bacillus pseudomycoides TaxID=64104 RepID=UPI000BEB4636|nr:sterol desaturase family protein [Bacillus pseudomycoides]PEE40939.1 fatty acid hydroxylase [Bacillus pseudomycoides]PGA93809.1 fatty acid hydroxylase [Bacillus pseudomycoides]PHF41443.1 fatty acid hydroxylase [Bacillus pseudomycoides]
MKRVMKEFFFQHDIVIMFGVCILFIIILKTQLFTGVAILSCLAGIVFYTINEYITHRFLFHMKPPKNPFLLKMLKRLHYDHHVYPDDLKLLFLPVWYSMTGFAIYLFILYGLTSNITITFSFGIGMIVMLLVYEWKHYIAHRPIRPSTRFGRWLKKQHILHHYKNENYWFGVSNPVYDFLFGTYKNGKEVELSETARNLEKEEDKKVVR